MASKPTKLPEWATDASRTVEPSAGEKGTGWQGGNKPPARKMNWLFNILYTWIQYVSDGVFVADASSGDEGIDAIGDGAAAGVKGTGGATNGNGVEGQGTGTGDGVSGTGGTTGAGVVGTGGATSGAGVSGTGGPNSDGLVGAGTGTGDGVSGTGGATGAGVVGTGGSTSGAGVSGTGGPNSPGAVGTGTGTGSGVKGVAGGTGYGVEAIGDTSSPARASLHVTPQDAEASTPAKGNLEVLSGTGRLITHNGTNWDRQVAQSHAITSDESQTSVGGPYTLVYYSSSDYTIPANVLRVGSTIRVRAIGQVTAGGTGPAIYVVLDDGSSTILLYGVYGGGGTGAAGADVEFTVRSIGGTGQIRGGGFLGMPGATGIVRNSGTLDTTTSILVRIAIADSASAATMVLEQLLVDIAG